MLRISKALLIGTAIAACAASSAQEPPSPKATEKLAQVLQGRTASQPVSCVPNLRGAARMEVIDDWTIVFRDGSTVYLQKPAGGCPGIKNRGYTLVSHKVGTHQFCEGDIQQLIESQTGIYGGSCVFGPFVPYRKGG